MLRQVLAYHEVPEDWLRIYSPLSGAPPEELSTWLMEPIAVLELISQIDRAAAPEGVSVKAITHPGLTNILSELTADTVLWNITDGCLPFHGSYVPAAAALLGLPFFGNLPFVQMLGQDKFKFYCFCIGIGIHVPQSNLVDQYGARIGREFQSAGFFVKPNSLGNSIGIGLHSRFDKFSTALDAATQLAKQYECNMLVQEFIEGTQFRSTFIDHSREKPLKKKIRVFTTKKTGMSANLGYIPHVPHNQPLYEKYVPAEDNAANDVVTVTALLVERVPLKDYGSFDIIVDAEGAVRVIDFNPCPFLDNESTRDFSPDKSLAEILWSAIKRSYEDQTKASRAL
jgi:D-alanine-D-alanine ligase-like ATP-grasp enzyme